jgi:Uma2 family endonuclease
MATAVAESVPPLSPGDRLSRQEFFRLWEMHPEIKNAELIGGIVYMPSPVSIEHGDRDADIGLWIHTYRVFTPGTDSGQNATACMLKDSPQPDINLRILQECGGRSWIEDHKLHGSPELLTEICRSSAAYDLHVKYELYQEARVQEYLAILLHEREIRWHALNAQGRYELLAPDAEGMLRSRVFPGLWLDSRAFSVRDLRHVLVRLQDGLASKEHEAFVKELARRKV